MSALSEWIVTFEGQEYPIDTDVWWWSDEELCQRLFSKGEDEWRRAISRTVAGVSRPEKWAQVALVAVALNRADDPPRDLSRFARFDTNGAWLRPADPDAFAAAQSGGGEDDADLPTLSGDSSEPTSG